jgi:hypothetical protein
VVVIAGHKAGIAYLRDQPDRVRRAFTGSIEYESQRISKSSLQRRDLVSQGTGLDLWDLWID